MALSHPALKRKNSHLQTLSRINQLSAACRLLLEAYEDYQKWVWEQLNPPSVGNLVWAKHHRNPFEILLAVILMAKTNQEPVVSRHSW